MQCKAAAAASAAAAAAAATAFALSCESITRRGPRSAVVEYTCTGELEEDYHFDCLQPAAMHTQPVRSDLFNAAAEMPSPSIAVRTEVRPHSTHTSLGAIDLPFVSLVPFAFRSRFDQRALVCRQTTP